MSAKITKISELKRGDRLAKKLNIFFQGAEIRETEIYDVVYVNKNDKEAVIRLGNSIEKIIKEENLKNINLKII